MRNIMLITGARFDDAVVDVVPSKALRCNVHQWGSVPVGRKGAAWGSSPRRDTAPQPSSSYVETAGIKAVQRPPAQTPDSHSAGWPAGRLTWTTTELARRVAKSRRPLCPCSSLDGAGMFAGGARGSGRERRPVERVRQQFFFEK